MPAYYDFFRKIKFLPNNVEIEADSTTDTAQLEAGVNVAFDVEDSTTGLGLDPTSTDKVIINTARYDTYVPNLGALPGEAAVIRLERDPLGLTGVVQTDITIESDPLSPILIDRIDANTIRIGSSSPTIPFSQEQIEDFAAQLLTGGTHTEITVNYDDLGSPVTGNIDLAVTSTLQQVTNRGATTTNAITISDATGSSNTSTGALRVTAGGLAVFENINAGGYVKGTRFESTIVTGTAPLTVASTTLVSNLHAATADAWHTARTITLAGDLSGSVSIDGSANVTLTATVETDKVALGTDTTGNYVAAGAVSGNGLSGSASSEGATFTVSSNATALNTAETIVFRNTLGDFAAGTITAALSGNATTATTLQTSRNINGVAFNGSADITVTASTTNALTVGTGLQLNTGTTFNGSAARTISIDSTVVTTTGTQTLTNKTFTDSTTLFQDETDTTKKLAFQLSGITTGNTRTLTAPDTSGTVAVLDSATTQVFTGAQTFRRGGVGGALRAEVADLQDAIILSGRAGGTNGYAVRLIPTTLTATHSLTLPNITGTVITSGDTGTVTNTMLANSTISGVSLGSNLSSLSAGTGLTYSVGSAYNGSAASTLAIDNTVVTTSGAQTLTGDKTFSGLVTLTETTETVSTLTGATGTVNHDFVTSTVWWHTSIAANFTANFTNVPTTDNRAIVITLFLVQGVTAFIPNAVQIAGVSQTINWANNATPAGTASRTDIVTFTLMRVGGAWTVFGSLTSS